MKKASYLALIRGINVGGKNIIKMPELKMLFEDIGLSGVQTYIQSGNVIFSDSENDKSKLKRKIEKALSEKLANKINVALLSYSEMKEIVENKPKGFGEKAGFKYDLIYVIEPLKAKDIVKEIRTREGVDTLYEGRQALYISRKIADLTKSYFSKIIEMPFYQSLTIRNWNTTEKLYQLMAQNRGDTSSSG